MSESLKEQINTIKTEADNLIGKAGFAMKNTKGFKESVDLMKSTINAIERLNDKIDAIQEAYYQEHDHGG